MTPKEATKLLDLYDASFKSTILNGKYKDRQRTDIIRNMILSYLPNMVERSYNYELIDFEKLIQHSLHFKNKKDQ